MDSGVVDSPVTLVIKAPNQKYDDQTINCFLHWTVEKLKTHLSKVYPSKPSSKDQRLVYSGRLLQDHLRLRDVLRKQDEYHMVHLVCACQTPPGSPQPVSGIGPSGTPITAPTSADSLGVPSSPTGSPSPPTSAQGSTDGLRLRAGPAHNYAYNPAVMQGPLGAQVPVQQGLPVGFPGYPMYSTMQLLRWQQMYAQHYYMQYQAAVASSAQTLHHDRPSTPNVSPAPQPILPNNPVQEERLPNANVQMNAQGGAVLNEDELNRDWLDWVYTVSRAAVLLGIVYYYSSFSRFVMVMGAMLLLYLHQAGWFPFRPEFDQQNLGGGANPEELEAEPHREIQEMERIMDEGLEEGEETSGEEGSEGPNNGPQPGFLSSAWSFIMTFFTSLIPEGPPHAAN
ncbi:hypothetical protein GJAV_G00098580 [Gymnothorax javanicus]|nr:hypothetical protein GJAV_G00098580 [Gymnothorax javanicus]